MAFIKKHLGTGLFIIGIILILIGITQGGFHDTMSKAIRICLECIGIG